MKRLKVNNSAYIIGGGTSLEEAVNDKALLEKLNSYTLIGCNKAVETFDCKYMVYFDVDFPKKHTAMLHNFKGKYIYAPDTTKNVLCPDNTRYFKISGLPRCDLRSGLYIGNNSGVLALSLTVALGYKNIYLLGMDCRFNRRTNKSHFHGGYQDPANENGYNGMATAFDVIGKYIKECHKDVTVYNCSSISLVDKKREYSKYLPLRIAINGH
jgi:hypothetical protein